MTITRIDPGHRLSKAVVHETTVFLAGLTASDLTQGTTGQTEQILVAIDTYLGRAGTSKSKLLTATIWLRDIADFDLMNAVWDGWIDRDNMPVRATVEARLAGDGYRVEIQVTAAL